MGLSGYLRRLMKKFTSHILLCFFSLALFGQSALFNQDITYSRQDTLRGSITPERAWWDLKHYDLKVTVDIENKAISGSNTISYEVLGDQERMQIDLQAPMKILRVSQKGKELEVEKEGNAHFITLKKKQKIGVFLRA